MDSMLDSAGPPGVASAPAMGGAGRRDVRVRGAAGRQPSLEPRRQGRDAADLRAWGSSEYADLDREDVLTKVRAKVCRVAVETGARGKATAAGEFGSWRAFTGWLGGAPPGGAQPFVGGAPGALP